MTQIIYLFMGLIYIRRWKRRIYDL